MTEFETKTEAEMEDFADELSDEALDREQGGGKASSPSGARSAAVLLCPACGVPTSPVSD